MRRVSLVHISFEMNLARQLSFAERPEYMASVLCQANQPVKRYIRNRGGEWKQMHHERLGPNQVWTLLPLLDMRKTLVSSTGISFRHEHRSRRSPCTKAAPQR